MDRPPTLGRKVALLPCVCHGPQWGLLCQPRFFLLSGEGQAFRHVRVFGRPGQRGLSSLPRSPGLQTQATPLGASPGPGQLGQGEWLPACAGRAFLRGAGMGSIGTARCTVSVAR